MYVDHSNYRCLYLCLSQLQKLLYSATLSQNPEKLQQLNLFQPKLYTSVLTHEDNRVEEGKMESQTTIGENDSQIMTAGDIVKCK